MMSRSTKKTKIFGNADSSEKKDKRINNRMFRRKENVIDNEIIKELKDILYESVDDDLTTADYQYPQDMNEVRNVWSMAKDGKSYWSDAPEKSMRK